MIVSPCFRSKFKIVQNGSNRYNKSAAYYQSVLLILKLLPQRSAADVQLPLTETFAINSSSSPFKIYIAE